MTELSYGFEKNLQGIPFEEAKARVTEALKAEGFGVLSEMDIKATLKAKLDADFREYVILGTCNPQLAQRALESETHIGLLLPCNVVVQQAPDGEGVLVSIADPRAMFTMVDNPAVEPVAREADERLRRVMDKLG